MEVVLSSLSLSACVSVTVIVSLMVTQLLKIWLKMTGIKCIHFLNAELSYKKHFGELLLQIIYLWKNELPHFMDQQNRHHYHHFSSFFLLTRKNKFFWRIWNRTQRHRLLLKSLVSLQNRRNFLCFTGEREEVLGRHEACMTHTLCCFAFASIQLKKCQKKYAFSAG